MNPMLGAAYCDTSVHYVTTAIWVAFMDVYLKLLLHKIINYLIFLNVYMHSSYLRSG